MEKSQQSPIKLEEKAPDREEVESEKQPSDVKPLTPAEAMEQEVKEVKEEAVAEEAAVEETTTDRQQEEPKKVVMFEARYRKPCLLVCLVRTWETYIGKTFFF